MGGFTGSWERAPVQQAGDGGRLYCAYEELTRWNDPKESVPDHEWAVLVRITTRIYDIGSYSNKMGRWLIGTNSFGRDEVLGWREIHE